MRGSHRPSLTTLVERVLTTELPSLPAHVLVACSGGADSIAMLHVLARLRSRARKPLPFALSVASVDHGLRAEAAAEVALVEAFAASLGLPFRALRANVAAGSNLQARARDARYALLEEERARVGADVVATAHTASDRAETVLLRLLRGTGLRGLGVLPPRAGTRLRPLIRATRADVELHARRNGLSFASDPSNLDTRFVRVRVRRELLPMLETLSPRIVESLNLLADEATTLPKDPLAGLSRAARRTVETARNSGNSSRFRVDDCKEVLVTMAGDEPVLTERTTKRRRGSPFGEGGP